MVNGSWLMAHAGSVAINPRPLVRDFLHPSTIAHLPSSAGDVLFADGPGAKRLLADVRSGKVSKVCVWRLDRLGRTAKGLLILLDELQALGVGFVSLREGFDLGTPAGRLMAGVLASVAAYETEVRKERQLAGIARAKADGKTWGGRKAGTRVQLTAEKEAVIRQLHGEGKAVASIARMVGLTRKTIYRALARDDARS